MTIAWITTAFTYFMIGFYIKYIKADIFSNMIISTIASLIATFLSGVVAELIGTKPTLIGSFAISGLFGMIFNFIPES